MDQRRAEQYDSPWRLASECPECGSALRLRHRKRDGGAFLGCRRYPACDFAEDFDPLVQELSELVVDLRLEVEELRGEKTLPLALDVGRELRALIALAHPDRHPGNALAHEITSRLTELRARLAA